MSCSVFINLKVFLLCTLCYQCQAKPKAEKQVYTIAGWNSIAEQALIKKMTPLFQTYLTEEIGNLYEPPIRFEFVPFFYDGTNSEHMMMSKGLLDFAYHNGGVLTCLIAESGYYTLASQISETLGYQTSSYGSVIFSAKSNTAIKSIADFKNKRLGVGYPWAPGSFLLGSQLLDELGLNIYTKFSQVVFYLNDYAAMIDDILAGNIDVAMIQSGWLEANSPQDIPKLFYHHLVNASYRSEPYPFPTSTKVVPSFGLAAAPYIPVALAHQVMTSLRKLNSTHPAAQAAGISRFTLPASYQDARDVVEHLGLMKTTPAGKGCVDIFKGLEQVLSCPSGYALKDRDVILQSCAAARRPCPSGKTCFCDPCERLPSNVFPWQLVVGLCCGLFVVGLWFWVCFNVMECDGRADVFDMASSRAFAKAKELLKESQESA